MKIITDRKLVLEEMRRIQKHVPENMGTILMGFYFDAQTKARILIARNVQESALILAGEACLKSAGVILPGAGDILNLEPLN